MSSAAMLLEVRSPSGLPGAAAGLKACATRRRDPNPDSLFVIASPTQPSSSRSQTTAAAANAAQTSSRSCASTPLRISVPPVRTAASSAGADRISSAPVRLAVTTSTTRQRHRRQIGRLEADARRGRIQREVFARRLDGVGIAVDPDRARGAEQVGGNRQHARSGADVEHDLIRERDRLQRRQAEPRRGMVPGAEAHRRLMTTTRDWDPDSRLRATGTAATTVMRPTVTGVRFSCERRAQSSSATSTAVTSKRGGQRAQRGVTVGWGRERRCALSRRARGLRPRSGRSRRRARAAGRERRVPHLDRGVGLQLSEHVLDAVEEVALVLRFVSGARPRLEFFLRQHLRRARRSAAAVRASASSASAPARSRRDRRGRGR